MTGGRRAGTGAVLIPVLMVVMALLGTACASTQEVRAVRPLPPPTVATTTTAPTTTVPSAVPTTVPTPVVPVVGWSAPATTLPPAGGFTSASCISDVFCLAAGGGANEADASGSTGPGVVSSWDGDTWMPAATYFAAPADGPTTAPELPAIACTDGPRCAVVDGSGHTTLGDGTTWTPPTPLASAAVAAADPSDTGPDHPGSRSAAVACPTSQFCAYVDNTGHVATLNGTTWTAPQSMTARVGSATVDLFQTGRVGIACADETSCTAIVGGTDLDYDGTSWTAGPAPWPASTSGATAVSCPEPGTCLAVQGSTASIRTPGSSWSLPRVIDANGQLDALSCPTTTFCMAADAYGNVVHLTGGSWSVPSKVVPTPVDYSADGTSVSCPTDQFCLVLNADGDYAIFQGSDPTPASTLPPTTTVPAS
ncbi:MAG TPA: hypothetical protein VIH95_09335 [Acidimicrobiales bacterium]